MKGQLRVILIALAMGLLFWLLDNVLDCLFCQEAGFWELLIARVPTHEIYDRSIALTLFLGLGLALSGLSLKRERVELALHQSEERYRRIVDTAHQGICLLDPAGKITYANRRLTSILGYEQEEMLHHCLFDFIEHLEEGEGQRFLASTTPGSRVESDFRFRCKDGSIMPALMTVSRITGDTGRCFGALAMIMDMTERRQAEGRLQLLSSVVEQSTEGVAVADLQGDLLFVNKAFATMHGYDPDELIGRHLAVFHTAEQMLSVDSANQQMQETGQFSGEIWHARRDGTVFPTRMQNSLLRNEDGNAIGMIATLRDISAEKELQEQLRQSQKLEAIGKLAGGVAHDFNNLLTGIKGYVQFILKEAEPGTQAHEDLGHTLKLANRAVDLTRQLLAFSRRQTLEMAVLDVNALLTNQLKMLGRLLGEDVDIRFSPEADLDNVCADRGQIEQVIMNLAVNARDAMPNGGQLTIETTNVLHSRDYAAQHVGVTPGPYVLIAVSDTGCGMDEGTRARAFEPFFTTKDEGQGTGLGLSTVYGIVKQHGGNTWVYSELDMGTTFKVYLPRTDAPQEVPDEAEEEVPRGSETVLLVEDEQDVRAVAERALTSQGYRVLSASHSDEAEGLHAQQDQPVDLLLTDVIMPGRNGRALYEQLASAHPSLKVLYISGYTDHAIVHHGVLDPGTAFLQKPFSPESLARRVREVLDA